MMDGNLIDGPYAGQDTNTVPFFRVLSVGPGSHTFEIQAMSNAPLAVLTACSLSAIDLGAAAP